MRPLLLLLSLLAWIVAPAAAAGELASVSFRATAEVDAAAIRLGDLAEVRCPDARLARELRELSIGTSPYVGGKSSFAASYARVRVRSLGLKDDQVRFLGAAQIAVSRPAQIVRGESLIECARTAVEALAPGSAIESTGTPFDRKVARGKVELKPGAPKLFARSAAVPVEILLDGKVVETVSVSFRVVKKVQAVVATHAIASGTILSESDLELREVPETNLGSGTLFDLALAVGKKLTGSVGAGAPISTGNLKAVVIVKRGDRVTLICTTGSFTLACTGEALADGAVGQTIRVKNASSGLELSGCVRGPGTIDVRF